MNNDKMFHGKGAEEIFKQDMLEAEFLKKEFKPERVLVMKPYINGDLFKKAFECCGIECEQVNERTKKMEYKSESFDLIAVFGFLELVNNRGYWFDEMLRVLKRGGILYFVDGEKDYSQEFMKYGFNELPNWVMAEKYLRFKFKKRNCYRERLRFKLARKLIDFPLIRIFIIGWYVDHRWIMYVGEKPFVMNENSKVQREKT